MVSSLMNEWKETYPSVLPLCLTLKHLLRKNKMGDSYTGGLSPYCLMIMVVAFLRHGGFTTELNSGLVLVEFLRFYSSEFDYKCTTINLAVEDTGQEARSPFLKKETMDGLMIIEPISGNEIKCTYSQFPGIVQYFSSLLNLLQESTTQFSCLTDPRIPLPDISCLPNPLSAAYPI